MEEEQFPNVSFWAQDPVYVLRMRMGLLHGFQMEAEASGLSLLSKARMERMSPCFPLADSVPRVDDSRMVRDIIEVIRNGLQRKDAPKDYGPRKTLSNSLSGGADSEPLTASSPPLPAKVLGPKSILNDAARLNAHRTAESLLE